MKAFILGAGLGTRLKPLTSVVPKPLIPFYNEPLVCHAMRHCLKFGIKEFAINTHHLSHCWEKSFPEEIFENSSIRFYHERELLETGGGLKNIESFVEKDSVLVYNGDILTNVNLSPLLKKHEESSDLATLLLFEEGPNCNIQEKGGRVVDIRGELEKGAGTHQFSGIYVIDSKLLSFIPPNKKVSVIPTFLKAVQKNKLGCVIQKKAEWYDLGTREEYLRAHSEVSFVTEAKVHSTAQVADSSKIENSFIGAGSVVGEGAIIRNSVVWSGSLIGENSQLEDCIVRGSVSGSYKGQDLIFE